MRTIHWKQQWDKKTNSNSNNINNESVQKREIESHVKFLLHSSSQLNCSHTILTGRDPFSLDALSFPNRKPLSQNYLQTYPQFPGQRMSCFSVVSSNVMQFKNKASGGVPSGWALLSLPHQLSSHGAWQFLRDTCQGRVFYSNSLCYQSSHVSGPA